MGGRARPLPSRVCWWTVNKSRLTGRFALPIADNGMGGWEGEAPAEPCVLVDGKQKPAHQEVRPPDWG